MTFKNNKALKILDAIFGPLLISLIRFIYVSKNTVGNINRIIIIRPGGIGDAVLLLPAIQTLKENLPGTSIDILAEKRNADIFRLSNSINKIYLYDRGFDIFRCLKNKYNVVIDTEQWHRLSAVVAYLTKAPVRIGFATNERERLFTHKIPYSHSDYEVYSFLNLIGPLLGPAGDFNPDEPFIRVPENINSWAKNTIEAQRQDVVTIFTGASVMEKRWGTDRFAELSMRLSNDGYKVILIGGKAELRDSERIVLINSRVLDLVGRTDLLKTTAVIANSSALITADSGIMHIAYGVGTPTVCLFGSSIEEKWAPRDKRHVTINRHLPCSPCTKFGYTPRCKTGVRCLKEISVDDVYDSLLISLQR